VVAGGAVVHDLYRFDDPRAAATWEAVDDRVMGGVSRSRVRHDPAGHAVFEGTLSLAQGGGFASVRADVALPAGAAPTCWLLEVRGDGRRYKFTLRASATFDAVSWQASFDAPIGEWRMVRLATADFIPTFRGRRVDAPPLDPARVRTLGLMFADRPAGPFALALRRVAIESD
jgi:NADH dehydrogenase [ubiquinone] 1 alpha subcomplex assembly factor 1